MAARGERLKEATTDAKRTIDAYREEKEKQFLDLVAKVGRIRSWCRAYMSRYQHQSGV